MKGVSTYSPWIEQKSPSPFSHFASRYYPIREEALRYIDEHTFQIEIERGELLVKSGELCPHLYLVLKGVLRGYCENKKKQITTWITAENELVTSIRSFDFQKPSVENIQALEDCTLIAVNYQDLHYLYENFMEMNVIARKILEQYYREAEERAFISRLTSAADKYDHFLSTKRDLHNRIPLKYIASYLGITLETLSRIRGARTLKKSNLKISL